MADILLVRFFCPHKLNVSHREMGCKVMHSILNVLGGKNLSNYKEKSKVHILDLVRCEVIWCLLEVVLYMTTQQHD